MPSGSYKYLRLQSGHTYSDGEIYTVAAKRVSKVVLRYICVL